jgi:uncharacterized protein (DUF697 family)
MSRQAASQLFWHTVRRARSALSGDRPQEPGAATQAVTSPDIATALKQLDRIRDECRAMVTRRASMSAGAAVVPIPGLDIGTDVAILIALLPRINEKFGLAPHQIDQLDVETKRVVMMFVSAVGSNLIGRLVTRDLVMKLLMKMGVRLTTQGVVKYVPLIGQAISASLSFGAMKLLGNRHVDDCYEVARRALLDAVGPETPRPATWEVVP